MQLLPIRILVVAGLMSADFTIASMCVAQGTAEQAQLVDLVKRLPLEGISNTERDRLVQQLSRGDAAILALPILKIMREHTAADEPGMPPKPWLNDNHSHRAKVWYAAGAVWGALFRGDPDPVKAAVLLKLLATEKDDYSRYTVLSEIGSHWNAAVEKSVVRVFEARESPSHIKRKSLELLLSLGGEKYVSHAFEFVSKSPAKEQAGLFGVFGSNRFSSYSQENQDRIVDLGFTILEREAQEGNRNGYFTATRLGTFVKAPNDFKPDQKDYQRPPGGTGGLTDAFFADTVKNALEWRKKHPPITRDRANEGK
jgi:hypothetical protein